MKKLADLKRDLQVGTKLKLIFSRFISRHKFLKTVRYVVKKNTQGICLNEDSTAKKGSYLDYPKASLLKYDGETITIYNSGKRHLTKKEKDIMLNVPKDEEQDRIDIMSDGSTMFWRRTRYYKEAGKYYLLGVSKEKGKRLLHGTRATVKDGSFSDWFIEDDGIKGDKALVYEIV